MSPADPPPADPSPVADTAWQTFRQQMPVAPARAYFDHAAVAPLSGPAADVFRRWIDDCAAEGAACWGRWRKEVERTRGLAAGMLGASTAEIALVRNTTEGISLIAESYPWQAGDNVVTLASEFPSNLYPWMNLASRGVETRQVPTDNERPDLDQLAAACDSRTRIISLSWVGYMTGWRNDLTAIAGLARERGVLLFVDAIQGLGVFPLDVGQVPIDFLAADGHKWMLGPEGAGVLYIRREHLERLRPLNVGWNSVSQAGNFSDTNLNLRDDAARYEGGTHNTGGLAALGASLKLLGDAGIDQVASRLLAVTDRLCDQLESMGGEIASCREPEHAAGIVSVSLPGQDPARIRSRCLEANVI
ncbi:MAG: aminotransferase class V-fold PLP-dependent enzyme, partial [Planctomycetaceae bacterium]|nr:aminotransferase class V-fold PLP-dependent enzyme [Planctomycetaceae bacterium]